MLINIHILEMFIDKNRLSAFRLYIYIKSELNNHLHSGDIPKISSDLQISTNVIHNNLRQLTKMGICYKFSNGYWRFNSHTKFCSTSKNRIVNILLRDLRSLKYIRTLYYALLIFFFTALCALRYLSA